MFLFPILLLYIPSSRREWRIHKCFSCSSCRPLLTVQACFSPNVVLSLVKRCSYTEVVPCFSPAPSRPSGPVNTSWYSSPPQHSLFTTCPCPGHCHLPIMLASLLLLIALHLLVALYCKREIQISYQGFH